MPQRQNPHENGLRRSLRLQEKLKLSLKQKKAHIAFGTAVTTKVIFGIFSLFVMTTKLTMPQQQINKDATFTQHCMNPFHKVNEL